MREGAKYYGKKQVCGVFLKQNFYGVDVHMVGQAKPQKKFPIVIFEQIVVPLGLFVGVHGRGGPVQLANGTGTQAPSSKYKLDPLGMTALDLIW